MAFDYKFFNSRNHDRVYYSDDWADFFDGLISNGVLATSADSCKVVPIGGMAVGVSVGRFLIYGHMGSVIETAEQLTIAQAAELPRIDRIVARLNAPARKMELLVLQGEEAETPVPPDIIRNEKAIYDICLAQIYVRTGAVEITEGDITDKRSDASLCGWTAWRTGEKIILDGKADKYDLRTKDDATGEEYRIGVENGDLCYESEESKESVATQEWTQSLVDEQVGGVTGYCVNNNKTRVETFTTSGTWVVPEGVTKVDIFLVGGGGGGVGTYSSGYYGGGGGGGYTQFVKDYMVTPGKTINYIVGAGGSGGSTTASAGGATSFGISVNGGSGAGSDPDYKGGDGGSGGSSYRNYTNLSGTNGGNGAGGMQSSRTITGGKGQGFPTMDPYTGTVYSAGGGLRSPGKYGDGGQAGSSGYSGVIKIYY